MISESKNTIGNEPELPEGKNRKYVKLLITFLLILLLLTGYLGLMGDI